MQDLPGFEPLLIGRVQQKMAFTILVENENGDVLESHFPTDCNELEQFLHKLYELYNVTEEVHLTAVTLKARMPTTAIVEDVPVEEVYELGEEYTEPVEAYNEEEYDDSDE